MSAEGNERIESHKVMVQEREGQVCRLIYPVTPDTFPLFTTESPPSSPHHTLSRLLPLYWFSLNSGKSLSWWRSFLRPMYSFVENAYFETGDTLLPASSVAIQRKEEPASSQSLIAHHRDLCRSLSCPWNPKVPWSQRPIGFNCWVPVYTTHALLLSQILYVCVCVHIVHAHWYCAA